MAINYREPSTQKHIRMAELLLEVGKEITYVQKQGKNKAQGYKYAKAEDILAEVREKLFSRGILILPKIRPGSIRHLTDTGGRSFVTTLEMEYTFEKVATPYESIIVSTPGAGADVGGDKGVYKALTGALKYMLMQVFLIPTGDDPEKDETVDKEQAGDRNGVPPIPLDRARAILTLAQEKNQAKDKELYKALKMKLIQVGLDKPLITNLNVDQAEEVEQWLQKQS